MLLRRFIDHVKAQNWTAVALDFFIVVMGVFIGIQVSNWNAERTNHLQEQTRLVALKQNIDKTMSALEQERETAKGAIAALKFLVNVGEGADEEILLENLRYAFFYGATFTPELNAYDDLKNSGELALLSSADLRMALAKMDSKLSILAMAQEDLLTVQQLNIDPYMMDVFDLRKIIEIGEGEFIDAQTEVDTDRVVHDPQTRNRFLMKLDLVLQLDKIFEDAEQSLTSVQEQLDALVADKDLN